jgi:phosphoglycolate phosphatase
MSTSSFLYILDLDGTLVDSLDDLTASVNVMRAGFALPCLDRQAVRGMVGQGARSLVERALPGRSAEAVDAGLAIFLAHNEAHLFDRTFLYPEAAETLAELSGRGHTLALLSNKNEGLCRKLLTHFGIDGYFSAVMGGDTMASRKPSPEPVLKLMSVLAHGPRETVMVGDSINDVAAGRDAGVMTVGCTYGYGELSELDDASVRINSFSELLQLSLHILVMERQKQEIHR